MKDGAEHLMDGIWSREKWKIGLGLTCQRVAFLIIGKSIVSSLFPGRT
jgi:hypothetical protein